MRSIGQRDLYALSHGGGFRQNNGDSNRQVGAIDIAGLNSYLPRERLRMSLPRPNAGGDRYDTQHNRHNKPEEAQESCRRNVFHGKSMPKAFTQCRCRTQSTGSYPDEEASAAQGPANGLTNSPASPKLMPSAWAACTAELFGSTRESDRIASAIGTLSMFGGR